jgi:hypothetical protein
MNLYDLQCREVVDVLTDFFEGALPVDHRILLEQHLLFCDGCAAFVEQLRVSLDLTGRLREADIPPPVMDRLLQVFSER